METPNSDKQSSSKLIQGEWYWVTYEYRYEISFKPTYVAIELLKCSATKDSGINGLFETQNLGKQWIGRSHCERYDGKMKQKFIFWGDDVPDVD